MTVRKPIVAAHLVYGGMAFGLTLLLALFEAGAIGFIAFICEEINGWFAVVVLTLAGFSAPAFLEIYRNWRTWLVAYHAVDRKFTALAVAQGILVR